MKKTYSVGDIVCYEPTDSIPPSFGFIVEVQDEDLIRVHWYVENILPHARRHREWIPAAILEAAGSLKILTRED